MTSSGGFSYIDYIVLVVYFAAMLIVGALIGKRQLSTSDYLLAGRKMAWWPVAISLFASLFSAVSFIAMPGEAYDHGMTLFLWYIIALIPMPIMIFLFLRLFFRLQIWTAYEYLERRFTLPVRIVGSVMFMLLRGTYMGLVLYATALALQPATGWNISVCILIVGISATAYTTLGGMAAVIWTDVIQFVVLLSGIAIILFSVSMSVDGGVFGIWEQATAMGHGFNVGSDSGFWNFDFYQRIGGWVWLAALLPMCVAPAIDQTNLQRCLSCKSFKTAGWAVFGSTVGSLPVTFLFFFTGLALLVFFRSSATGAGPASGDVAFTYYIMHELPVGVRGLIMAAILAAVMSTMDSVINSLSAVSVKDLYARVIRPGKTDQHYLKVAKGFTIFWGVAAVGFGLFIAEVVTGRNFPLLEVSNVALGFFGGAMLGVFALGLLCSRANTIGVIIGALLGTAVAGVILWVYYLAPPPAERISFLWIPKAALLCVFIFGYIASRCVPASAGDEPVGHVVWKKWNRVS